MILDSGKAKDPTIALSYALPPDIVRCIAEYLHDSPTLASLCLVDKQSLALVLPLLYNTVCLTSVHTISAFCNSILQSTRNLGHYPHYIHFEPPDTEDKALSPLIEPICQTLERTPHLTDLSLCIDTPNILTFYQHFQTHAPFSLNRFTCYNPSKLHYLIAFFSIQPTITHLTIYEPSSLTSAYARPYIRSLPTDVLPNLTSVCANPLTIHACVPGRPITHVDSDNTVLFNATTYLFCEGLKQSTAPGGVISVAVCIPQTKFWTGASDFVTRLGWVCGGSLKDLRLTMADLSVGMSTLGDYAALVEVLVASLGEFTRLERFQFDDMRIEIMTSEILIEGLGEVATLAFWQGQVRTLTSVMLFGVNLT